MCQIQYYVKVNLIIAKLCLTQCTWNTILIKLILEGYITCMCKSILLHKDTGIICCNIQQKRILLRMLLCSGWNWSMLELLSPLSTQREVPFSAQGKKIKRVNLSHLVHWNHTNSWPNTREIWTKGLDGTITFHSGASLCSLKVFEETRPSGVLHSQGIWLHFCLKTIPYLSWKTALEDRWDDFSALNGRPSYTESQFYIRMLIVVSINSNAEEFVYLLQLVQQKRY